MWSSILHSTPIKMWVTMDIFDEHTLKGLIKNFQQKYPGVKVQVDIVFPHNARRKFIRASKAGNAPDIFHCDVDLTPLLADRGYLSAIEHLIPASEINDYLTAPLAYCRYNGKLWGLPHVTYCLALFYNKRHLKKANIAVPGTMKQLYNAAVALTDRKRKRYGFFMTPEFYFFQPFVWAFGGGLISNDRKILINNKGSLEAFRFFQKLRKKVMPRVVYMSSMNRDRDRGFKNGKYSMIFRSFWAVKGLLKGLEFKKTPSNLGIAVIPRGPKGYGSPVSGNNWLISRNCKRVKDAVKLIRFLNSTKNQVKFVVNNIFLPTRKSAYAHPKIRGNYFMRQFFKQLKVARNRPVIPEGYSIYGKSSEVFQAFYQGKISPAEAVKRLAASCKKLLKKPRK